MTAVTTDTPVRLTDSTKLRAWAEAVAIPVGALLVSALIFSLFLLLLGKSPIDYFQLLWRGGFGTSFSIQTMGLGDALLPLAILAMFVGSGVAIFQPDIKRMLAYSSVAQIGYMVLGIGIATTVGLTAGILHLFNHALMKGALFMANGCVFLRLGSVRMDAMHGIGKTMPWTMGAFVAGGLSLIGVPATAGFISKWYLILAALERDWWWAAVLILLSSLLAIIYVWRVIEVAYFRPPTDAAAAAQEAPLVMLIPLWVLTVANVYFGLDTRVSVGIAEQAAQSLMGGGS